jgi:hypothetical protein
MVSTLIQRSAASPSTPGRVRQTVYNVRDYGAAADRQRVTDGVMTNASAILTSATAAWAARDVGKTVYVAGAGAAGAELASTIASRQSATQVTLAAVASTSVSGAQIVWGTDDTAAFQGLLAALSAAGGGTGVVPAGLYLLAGQLVHPANGGSGARSLRLTGSGTTRSASGLIPAWGTLLDMRYAGSDAKIVTLNYGCLELDHITFHDSGVDTLPFILTTRTTLLIHDNEFYGTGVGTASVQDAIVLGGATQVLDATVTSQFAGYGTVITANFFNKVRRAALLQSYANSVVFSFNTIWSGGGGVAPIDCEPVLSGDNNAGAAIVGNLIEITNYTYGIKVKNSRGLYIAGNNMHDWGAGTTAYYRFEADAQENLVIAGALDSSKTLISDANGSNSIITPYTGLGAQLNAAPVVVSGPSGGLGTAMRVKTNAANNIGLEVQETAAVPGGAITSMPLRIVDSAGNVVMELGRDNAGRLNPALLSSKSTDPNGSLALWIEGYGSLNLNTDTNAAVNISKSGGSIGAFGATATTRPTVSGSRGGNAALASLLTALATLGWITDSSSA